MIYNYDQAIAMSPLHATDETFDRLIAEATGPVLAEFSSDSCPPCQAMIPVLHDLAAEHRDRLTVLMLDGNQSPVAWRTHVYEAYGVQTVPSFVLFDKGARLGICFGLKSKSDLTAWIAGMSPGGNRA